MNKTRIFARTGLGNDALEDPDVNLGGDEKRLLALINGHVSVDEIFNKVPFSVQTNLEEMLTRLLSASLITEIAETDISSSTGADVIRHDEQEAQAIPAQEGLVLTEIEIETGRRIELEHELAEVRAELLAMTARQKRIDSSCMALKQQITDYTESIQAKLSATMQTLSLQDNTESELRVSFERELTNSLDSLHQLNQALVNQQKSLEKTLELNALQVPVEDTQQQSSPSQTRKMTISDPRYRLLRGLDFFKAFGNSELIQFMALATWQKAKAGDTILRAGEVGMPFYIIVSGSVNVLQKDGLLASLEKGDTFGEFSYLSGEFPLRSAHVVASTACELMVVEPLEIEFSTLQMRLYVAEALLRNQIRKLLRSNQLIYSLSGYMGTSA